LSAIKKLLQTVTEYGELLQFLHSEHPDVLKKYQVRILSSDLTQVTDDGALDKIIR
jgi:hypothetical protein